MDQVCCLCGNELETLDHLSFDLNLLEKFGQGCLEDVGFTGGLCHRMQRKFLCLLSALPIVGNKKCIDELSPFWFITFGKRGIRGDYRRAEYSG